MNCPRCGEAAERGQLVCLECGGRLALKPERDERRRFENVPAVALLLCVVVIGAAAFGFALSELTDGSSGQSSAADRPERSTPRRLDRRRRRPRPRPAPRSSRAAACCSSGPTA